jgi:hypothetical protein
VNKYGLNNLNQIIIITACFFICITSCINKLPEHINHPFHQLFIPHERVCGIHHIHVDVFQWSPSKGSPAEYTGNCINTWKMFGDANCMFVLYGKTNDSIYALELSNYGFTTFSGRNDYYAELAAYDTTGKFKKRDLFANKKSVPELSTDLINETILKVIEHWNLKTKPVPEWDELKVELTGDSLWTSEFVRIYHKPTNRTLNFNFDDRFDRLNFYCETDEGNTLHLFE